MKKFHLIFFLNCSLPLFLAAQQNLLPKKNPAPGQTKKTIKIASRHSKISNPLPKNSNKGIGKEKSANSHQRKRISAGTIYGNEWINYTQKYYKIKVGRNGIYRIDSSALAKAGIPVDTINNLNYQFFFRGQQQYIYINSHTAHLSEKNRDYIEFYGQYNDGVPDSTLYYNSKFIPNPYYSLFTDTSVYYLTWNSLTTNYRMTEQTDTAFGSYGAAASYIIAPTGNLENGRYFPGAWTSDDGFTPNDPRFTQNAAWTPSAWIGNNSTGTLAPDVGNIYTGPGAPNAFLRTVVLGVDMGNCTITVSSSTPRALWNNLPCNNNAGSFASFDLDTTFPASDIIPGFHISYYNNPVGNGTMIAPTYLYLTYPHTLDLSGDSTFMMYVPNDSTAAKTYLYFTDFYANGPSDSIRMYDLTNHNRFWVKNESGGYKVIVPNSAGLKQCYLTSDSEIVLNTVKNLTPVGINRNGIFTNFSIEPANTYVIVTHPTLWSAAQNYAAYRASTGFAPVVADVEELYDQFGEGVYYSPLGIRRFCSYAIDKWKAPPSYLFFIGKGIHTPIIRPDTAKWSRAQLLVPSYGYPSSDILFTNGLEADTLLEPAIPTGRIAAQNATDVNTYLSKVETYENAAPALWMKKIAHFAGGNTFYSEAPFLSYLNGYANIIMDTLFGANVYTFQKTSPAPISASLTDSIRALIDTGVSIMTFFGHASGSNWDESIDYPSDYTNYGKYPFIIADACYSGDIFQPIGQAISSVSEQFVLESPGSIGFLSSDYLGDPPTLATYTGQLYEDITYPFYRKSIGSIIQNTIETWEPPGTNSMTFTCLEMILHGDPAIAINAKDSLPDYAVNSQSIYFSPANVSVLMDSFAVNVIVSNYAEALNQPVSGILTRTFPDGTNIPYIFTFNHIYYQDTVSIRLPVSDSTVRSGEGLNYFTVSVNLFPKVDTELTYYNNSIGNQAVPLWITSEDITPVWPYDYAIIPKDTVTLKASTNDPFAPQRTYIFEIDTSHNFNSRLFRSDTVTQSGGVVQVRAYDLDSRDTIHYNGQLKPGGNGRPNKIALKERESTVSAPSIKNTVSGNANKKQNVPVLGRPVTLQQNTIPATNIPLNGKSPIQATGSPKEKNLLLTEKSHYTRTPIKDSFINGAVYYWRVRRDTADLKDYPWVMSSFQYIKNKNGWGQSNFFQYDNDELFNDGYNFINFNPAQRNWTFNTNGHNLECFTFGMIDLNPTELLATEYQIDDFIYGYAGCQIYKGIYVAVINPTTLVPWSTAQYDFGNANDSARQPYKWVQLPG